jgi:glutathione synthase/RimK-type ligase-like ATP-grasp enzyme
MRQIGIVCNVKKRKQFMEPFIQHVNTTSSEYHAQFLDFDSPQEPIVVDILFMKVTDDMNVEQTNQESHQRLNRLREYINQNPHILLIEKLEAVQRVLDRVIMYSFLHEQFQSMNTTMVHVPRITILENQTTVDQIRQKLNQDKVTFPIVCKTVAACGDIRTHNMALVFNEEQLLQVMQDEEQQIPLPIVAQQYINHDGILHKAYVVGSDNVVVQQRPSLRNLYSEPEMIRFNSQYKLPQELTHNEPSVPSVVDPVLFHEITSILSQALELQLFGFDIIQETTSLKFYVVDANYLPSYSTLQNVMHLMLEHIKKRDEQHRNK